MSTSRYNLFSIASFILLLVNYKFLYLFKLPDSYGERSNEILFVLVTVCMFLVFIYSKNRKTLNLNFQYTKYLFLIYIIVFIEMLFTMIKYTGEPSTSAFIETCPYLALLSYYIFSSSCQLNYSSFLKQLMFFSTIASTFAIVEYFLYLYNGISLFKFFGFNYGQVTSVSQNAIIDLSRNGQSRLIGSDLIDFSSVIPISLILNNKKNVNISKIYAWINLLLIYSYELFISKTRSVFIFTLMTFLLLFILKISFISNGLKKVAMFIIAILFSLFLFIKLKIEYINHLDYSYYHRVDEAAYYIEVFKNNFLFGNGLLKDVPNLLEDYERIHGFNSFASNSYNDIGIIGQMGKFGILGMLISLYFPFKTYSILKEKKKMLILAILVMSTFSLFNLSLVDAERLPVLAIYMALVDGAVRSK